MAEPGPISRRDALSRGLDNVGSGLRRLGRVARPRRRRGLLIDEQLYRYVVDASVRDHHVLRALREETAALPYGRMQVGPDHGQLLGLLVKMIGATRTIEVGVFTGYSALCTAMALPDHGEIVACDVSEEWTSIAKRHWKEAGVDHKIDLRLAPAEETLDELLAEGQAGRYDFAFIDADKTGYDTYYERCLELLRPGGVIAIDNVLWGGAVADARRTDPDTEALRNLNAKLAADDRIDTSLLTVGDGIALVRKR